MAARGRLEVKCECGADRPCLIPMLASHEEWNAFWAKHPARAGIKPLSREAAERKGAPRR